MWIAENPQAEQQKEIRAAELRGQIVRAQSWGQLFRSPEEAEVDFQTNLVDAWRFYHGKDNPKVKYTVQPHPNGSIHIVSYGEEQPTTYQRFLNGDVALTNYSSDTSPHVSLITPNIGNIAHPYTTKDIAIDEDALTTLIDYLDEQDNQVDSDVAERLVFISGYMRGKSATQGWENTMLHNGYMPQRIGYRLFPDFALESLIQFKEQYPQLVAKP